MNIKERIIELNKLHLGEECDIDDVLLSIISKFQLFEPCRYMSEDDEWLNVAMISIENEDFSQALSIRKSEITTFGIFNNDNDELSASPQVGSEDLYQ